MGDKLCDLCHNNEGKYACPVCGLLYCSVSCFRSEQHSQCSENFYKKCVEDELKLQQKLGSSEEISTILWRTQNVEAVNTLDSDDDSDESGDSDYDASADEDIEITSGGNENEEEKGLKDLAKRMENVDLDNESEIWEKLSANERKEFETMIQNGGIRNVLPDWEPWWMIIQPNPLIVEINAKSEDHGQECMCPPLNVEIPTITDLTKKIPAPSIPFMLANVLMAYAYTARWFKGKHADMPVEGITSLFALSSVIRSKKILSSFSEAFMEFEHDLKDCKWATKCDIDGSQIRKDLFHIVKGSKGSDIHFSIKASLCNIYNLAVEASEILKDEAVTHFVHSYRFTGTPPSLSEIKLLLKKIIYYLSWTETYGQQLSDTIAVAISGKSCDAR